VSNWYLCNHPDSQFLKSVIAARAEPAKRHALRGTRYSVHFPSGHTERRVIDSVLAYRELLEGPFTIRLPDAPNLEERLATMIDDA
jgi:N-hydroxyarylamine O-acetyltransferase